MFCSQHPLNTRNNAGSKLNATNAFLSSNSSSNWIITMDERLQKALDFPNYMVTPLTQREC